MTSPRVSIREDHVSYRSSFTYRYLKSIIDQYTCPKCAGSGFTADEQDVCSHCRGLGLTRVFSVYSPVQESDLKS